MLTLSIILILIILSGIMVKSTFEEKIKEISSAPVTFEIHPPKGAEKLYCMYCGRVKPDNENICHFCKHYNYVTLDELIYNLCRDVRL